MKLFRILGAMAIPLMLTGCMTINITAGSGIEQEGDGGPGRGGVNYCATNAANQCIYVNGCTCPPWSQGMAP